MALRYICNTIFALTWKKFIVDHIFSCLKGGFPVIRHNEIRDRSANLLTEVCHDVCVKPDLKTSHRKSFEQSSSNRQDGARFDIVTSCCWSGHHEKTFFGVKLFNPHVPSNKCFFLLSETRKIIGKLLWTVHQRSRASHLYFPGPCHHWWFGKGSQYLLQETFLPSRNEVDDSYSSILL